MKICKKGIIAFAAFLLAGFCIPAGTAQAAEADLVSCGSLLYESEAGTAAWYAADLLLLREKLSSMPEQCYDPACYSHDHLWIYRNISDATHTRHCDGCGDSYDLISAHTAAREESCAITYDGKSYPGRRYTCACGRQWIRETGHTIRFEASDAVNHTSRCALDGTDYCPGYEPVTEEHYAYYYIPGGDGTQHEKVCLDCGRTETEACSFMLEDPENDETGAEQETGQGENLRWCICGNHITIGEADEAAAAPEETPAPETGEPPIAPTEETPEPESGEPPAAPVEEESEPEIGEPPAEETPQPESGEPPVAPVEEESEPEIGAPPAEETPQPAVGEPPKAEDAV